MFKCNLGPTDRFLRILFGAGLIVGGFFLQGTAGIVMGVVGLIPLLTGVAGHCPAYSLFKINTCRTDSTKPV